MRKKGRKDSAVIKVDSKLKMCRLLALCFLLAAAADFESRAVNLEEYSYTEDSSSESGSNTAAEENSVSDGSVSDGSGVQNVYTGMEGYAMQATIYETYHPQYNLYQESVNNIFFFYSNVENGGFTEAPVVFDLPVNLSYTLEREGEVIAYTAGEEIREAGHYVLRITGTYNETIYQSAFPFSIREEADAPEESETAESEGDMQEEADPAGSEGDMREGDEEEQWTDEILLDPSEDISQEELDAMIEDAGAAAMAGQEVLIMEAEKGTAEAAVGMVQTFDAESNMYCHFLKSGSMITSNIPNGAVVNGEVFLQLPASVSAVVYHNGEVYENAGTDFTEEGYYCIIFEEDMVDFLTEYQSQKEYPRMVFRIVNGPVGSMEFYNAPLHTEIIYAELDGEILLDATESGSDGTDIQPVSCYRMASDGIYRFTMREQSCGTTYSVELTRDTQAPRFQVEIKNGVANINYLSEDIVSYALTIDGVPQSEFSPNRMEGKGIYRLTVTDAAGNEELASFELSDAVNYASCAAVGILLFLVIGAAVGIRKIHASFHTR